MMAYAVGDVVCWVLSTTAGESFFMGHPKAGSILVLDTAAEIAPKSAPRTPARPAGTVPGRG